MDKDNSPHSLLGLGSSPLTTALQIDLTLHPAVLKKEHAFLYKYRIEVFRKFMENTYYEKNAWISKLFLHQNKQIFDLFFHGLFEISPYCQNILQVDYINTKTVGNVWDSNL